MMRVLAITKIFPNSVEPLSSAFNRQQFGALAELCDLQVLATVPWFPGARRFGKWSAAGRLVDVPPDEWIDRMYVQHPRYFFVPRYGHAFAGALYATSLLPTVMRLRGRVDVILAAWAYPDGAAAVMLGELLRLPVVVKLHGSDINVVARMPGPRWNLQHLLPRARRVVAVSRPLAREAIALGVSKERVSVVYNGVDPQLFKLMDRNEARRAVGWRSDEKMVLYVGRLEREKGVNDLLDAFVNVRGADLVLVGDGKARREAAGNARVHPVGPKPLSEVGKWMAACDVLVLPSWNEGTPNVVLEAFSCGRPVVATSVGGIPDLIDDAALGALVPARDAAALAAAISRALETRYDPDEIVDKGAHGDWKESASNLMRVLVEAAA
jgi:glycosyltransferase involved in cell wall biosynthesis